MRGKLTYYNDKTGIGAIVNLNKKTFEFRKGAWHDTKVNPERGMYVDFREDESGHIADCRESVFKELVQSHGIVEKDFWNSKDDEELKSVAEEKREALLNKHLDKLKHDQPIKPVKSIEECCEAFYGEPITAIYAHQEFLNHPDERQMLDYFRLKRFLHKAKSHLLSTDSTISSKLFAQIEQDLMRLEYQFAFVKMRMKVDLEDAYVDIFLGVQTDYIRVTRRIKMEEERMFQLKAALKQHDMQITQWSRKAKTSDEARIKVEKLSNNKVALNEKLKKVFLEHKGFVERRKEFEQKYLHEFLHVYKFEEQQQVVHDYLKQIIDHLGWQFDDILWKEAIHSNSIQMNFYKTGTIGAYCAMTFLRAYLKPLNKKMLNKADEMLYKYLKKYEKHEAHHILVVSDSQDFSESVRIALLQSHKDILVHTFSRAVESLPWMKENNPNLIIIDASVKTLSAVEYITRYFTSHAKSHDAEFLLLTSNPNNDTLNKLRTLGVNHFGSKPVSQGELGSQTLEILELV